MTGVFGFRFRPRSSPSRDISPPRRLFSLSQLSSRATNLGIVSAFAIYIYSTIKLLNEASCNLVKNLSLHNEVVESYGHNHRDSMIELDFNNICPPSSAINSISNNMPPPKLMSHDETQSFVKYWHEINCPQKDTCRFSSIGQNLLHLSMKRNKTLLTLQVGAMDGKSNDPMYGMFVKENVDLRNWLPVLIEPVPKNYQDLTQTYLEIAKDKGLGCAVPIHAAVSYDSTKSICPFCRVNTADDSPQTCKGK
jgi:hypothetical protein